MAVTVGVSSLGAKGVSSPYFEDVNSDVSSGKGAASGSGAGLVIAGAAFSCFDTKADLEPRICSSTAFGFGTAQFADPIHPTAVVNGFVANEIILQMNQAFDDSVPFYSELELAEMAGLLP